MNEAPSEAVRVCIVDDDVFVTTSLSTILSVEPDMAVVGEGHDGNQAIELFEHEMPDILLMDIQMPGRDGLSAAAHILRRYPQARIVLLTTFSDDEYIVRALRMGAKGYLIKQEVATIAPALRTVMAGQSVLGGEVLGRVEALMRKDQVGPGSDERGSAEDGRVNLAGLKGSDPRIAALTKRERAIMELVAEGLDNKEIAGHLYLSEGTVRNHISAILQKLSLKNRTQLAICYYRMP